MLISIICTIPLTTDGQMKGRKVDEEKDSTETKLMESSKSEEEEAKASDITVFAGSCTLHGISHIFLPGGVTVRRSLWACAFLMSLSIFLYQVADRVIYYLEYHHVTTLDEQDTDLMTFPAITICNYNSFRVSTLTNNDLYWIGGLIGVEKEERSNFLEFIGKPSDLSNFFPSKDFSMQDFFQRGGHNIEEMLLECQYRSEECKPENFTSITNP
uniref:Uncharacterized protein n=1 Tax=Latimeria chalumnae TaxID=7897 RepID=H2ZRI4_LATCH